MPTGISRTQVAVLQGRTDDLRILSSPRDDASHNSEAMWIFQVLGFMGGASFLTVAINLVMNRYTTNRSPVRLEGDDSLVLEPREYRGCYIVDLARSSDGIVHLRNWW